MSWLYSQALVAEYLGENFLDGEQSVPSNGNPTPQAYCAPDKMTAFCRLSRFGMTYKPLTDELGKELLTLFLEAFPVKTSALQEKAQESQGNDQECGVTWRASLAKYDPDSCSWKTVQHSLFGDLESSSVTWPKSGMTAGGLCWELPTLERHISGTDSGLWLGTPTACMSERSEDFKRPSMTPAEFVKKFPTPTVYDSTGRGNPRKDSNLEDGGRHGVSLHHFVAKWPTPTVCGNHNRKGASATSGDGLATAVYQTPVARMWKDNGQNPSELERNSPTLAMLAGGSLNPTWVEWLMGWPLGWTDLKPLATDKFPYVPQQLGDC